MEKGTFIDAEKFAFNFATAFSHPISSQADTVRAAKKYLLKYLTAYYLVEEFNGIEQTNFNSKTETHFKDMTFDELMHRVQHLNKY
ncbi:MAG: hypothetical protein Q4A55_00390 [Aerococcus sp.]|nr:hypothetical protein [Aerococcus sp.]